MNINSIISQKRDNVQLTSSEIEFFIKNTSSSAISDAQLAAFTMAIYLNGLSIEETATMCRAMCNSGMHLSWDSDWQLDGPVVDKHSTGGVGDCVSLILAPLLAACGLYVPMISGRGLGHTGGTIDKLESIPGYCTEPDVARFQRCVKQVGAAIVSQSASLAPADRRIYAIRDQVSTVSSIPLIVSSILSKKLAEGLDALVMDIKVGNGAFITNEQQATVLSDWLRKVGKTLGLEVNCIHSQMNMPMSFTVGNALEVGEVIDFLTGKRRNVYLQGLVEDLATQLLLMTGTKNNPKEAQQCIQQALNSGLGAEKFAEMMHFLGGPSDLVENPDKHLIAAPVIKPVLSSLDGTVTGYSMKRVGELAMQLGAGRSVVNGPIDHRVGLSELLPVSTQVNIDTPLVWIHAASEADWEQAAQYYVKHCVNLN